MKVSSDGGQTWSIHPADRKQIQEEVCYLYIIHFAIIMVDGSMTCVLDISPILDCT